MGLAYKASLPLTALVVPIFALFLAVAFELSLQLTALLSLSLSLGVSLTLPTIALSLGLVVALLAQFSLAIELGLPGFSVNLSLAFSFELALVLGLLGTLKAILSALLNASLVAYAYAGSGADLGTSCATTFGSGWPDGTASDTPISLWLLVATTSGSYTPDQVESVSLLPPPPLPPTPPSPPPPAGAYPPPQAYERGLASVVFSAPPPGGVQAQGTLTITDGTTTGIGAVTGVTMTTHGSGYVSPASATISDTVALLGATDATPIVLTLPDPLSIAVGTGFGCSVANVQGNTAANGSWNAKVVTPTTVALYSDAMFTVPSVGSGTWVPGTGALTGGGTGAAVLATMGGGAQQALRTFFDGLRFPAAGLEGGVITLQLLCGACFEVLLDLLGNLEARAALLASASAGVALIPPTVAASIDLLLKIQATLRANLDVKLPGLQAAASAALSAQIGIVGKLYAGIALLLSVAHVDLEVWRYDGPGAGAASAIAAGPGTSGWHDGTPASAPVAAMVLAATNSASLVAFSTMFSGAT
jgi:hypothetical protein